MIEEPITAMALGLMAAISLCPALTLFLTKKKK